MLPGELFYSQCSWWFQTEISFADTIALIPGFAAFRKFCNCKQAYIVGDINLETRDFLSRWYFYSVFLKSVVLLLPGLMYVNQHTADMKYSLFNILLLFVQLKSMYNARFHYMQGTFRKAQLMSKTRAEIGCFGTMAETLQNFRLSYEQQI